MSFTDRSPAAQFQSTQWSLVLAARQRRSPSGQEAFAELCQRYWYPLYAHARRRGHDEHHARDLVQEFFATVIEKEYLSDADPRRGRFRTFLLASFGHHVANLRDKERAQKRGGGYPHIAIDMVDGEHRYGSEPVDEMTPDQQFECLWARALLRKVLDQLADAYDKSGKQAEFKALQPCLTRSTDQSYAEIGVRLNMSEGAVKAAVYRMKKRFRELLRHEIAQTVSHPAEVDDEINTLFKTFQRPGVDT